MATITAKGWANADGERYGWLEITIKGKKDVEHIQSSRPTFAECLADEIRQGYRQLMPCYTPQPNTMVQAYAVIMTYFQAEAVNIDAEMEKLLDEEPIYDEAPAEGDVY